MLMGWSEGGSKAEGVEEKGGVAADGRIEGAEGGASLSEDRLMWVSKRTPERNGPLFDSQLSDRPCGLVVQGRRPHAGRKVGFKHWLSTCRTTGISSEARRPSKQFFLYTCLSRGKLKRPTKWHTGCFGQALTLDGARGSTLRGRLRSLRCE